MLGLDCVLFAFPGACINPALFSAKKNLKMCSCYLKDLHPWLYVSIYASVLLVQADKNIFKADLQV